jgi:CheY-like chemotaxis protein
MNMASRVLVVDDSPTVRRVVVKALSERGYDVAEAAALDEGLVQLEARGPLLLVLGGVPPDHDGWMEHLERVCVQHTGRLAVVLIANRAIELDRRLRQAGVVEVVTKPFSAEALVAVVSRALNACHLARTDDFDDHEHTVPGMHRASAHSALLHTDVDGSETGEARRPRLAGGYALTGDLAVVALPELLQLIKLQGQTGLLAVDTDHLSVDIAFEAGHVVGVLSATDGPRIGQRGAHRLGRYLVATGGTTPARLEASLATIPRGGLVGLRLVEAGVIDEQALHRAVTEQAHDTMVELLRAQRGVFGLRPGPEQLPHAIVRPGWSVDGLLIEALRRLDEWGVMESEVGSIEARFTVRHPPDLERLSLDEATVLRLVAEGPVRVIDIIERSLLLPFDVCRVLYRLASLKRIERLDGQRLAQAGERPRPSEPLLSLVPVRSSG